MRPRQVFVKIYTYKPTKVRYSMQSIDDQEIIAAGRTVLEIEANALIKISNKLDGAFAAAARAIFNCAGRVIVMGLGKSGHVARKIAATFASTGTPAYFVHPTEAAHGDLGMITAQDIILAISNSGETQEIISLVPSLKRNNSLLICLVGKTSSSLAALANITLDVSVDREACALNLAPTASTTATLAMGDALAVSVLQARGFTEEDFARSHPGGTLGRRLLVKISDIMQSGAELPKVFADAKLPETILEITAKRLGMTTIVDQKNPNQIIGICTDGDLRRAFSKALDVQNTLVRDIMSTSYKTIKADLLAIEAVHLMQQHKISALPVVDHENNLVGALNMHNLFAAGVV